MNLFFLEEASQAESGNGMSAIIQIGILVLIMGAFYFIAIRPQKKQEKEAAKMREELEVGDEITTIGGIVGRVVSIKDETILIETGSDRSKMRIKRWAIQGKTDESSDSGNS